MDLKERLKEYEGTKAYQTKLKYFRNDKFFPYNDSLGKSTIGYGHLIISTENFTNGISESEADTILDVDIGTAKIQYNKLGLVLPDDWQDFMIIMIFQLGYPGVLKFRKMIEVLRVHNYPEAIKQAKDSLWYRQTPNRLNEMVKQLQNK